MVAMSFYRENVDPVYDSEDYLTEVSQKNLRRARNAHILIGMFMGGGLVLVGQYLFFWTIGVF